MKKIILFFSICSSFLAFAQAPTGYYSAADGKSGADLKTALYNTIKGHTVRTYSNLWTDFESTDKRADGKVWELYTSCDFIFGVPSAGGNQDNGTLGSAECQRFNREHSFPKSWFGVSTPSTSSPPSTDLFHIIPADKYVNTLRSNNPYGEVGSSVNNTFSNGSKLGVCSFPGYSGKVYEPANEYKGDLARGYFYMATRYETNIAAWEKIIAEGDAIMNGTSFPAYETWFISLLTKWHQQDPVSQKEIDRNNAIYAIQGNRNPYIDHPEYVGLVWGVSTLTGGTNTTAAPIATNVTFTGAKTNIISGDISTSYSDPANLTLTLTPFNGTLANGSTLALNTNGSFSFIPYPTFTGFENYSYTICNPSTCSSGIITFNITTTGTSTITGITEQVESKLSISPNPVTNYIKIHTDDLYEEEWTYIQITDLSGHVVCHNGNILKQDEEISIENLIEGMYFIKIISKNNVLTSRFVKLK